MTLHLWPRRLATRTAVVVLVGLALVQIAGLTIHALDRIDIQRLSQARNIAVRVVGLYRLVATTTPAGRDAVLVDMRRGPILDAEMSQTPPTVDMPEMPPPEQRLYRVNLSLVPMGAPQNRWKELVILGGPDWHRIVFGMKLPEGDWLNVTIAAEPARPWHSPTFLAAFGLMTLAAALLTVWAVRRLITPVQTLAAAAEALGRDVNTPPLPETGPLEIATAAAAFNTMAARIRRFVEDRTELLTAIGHDLRTPITRLKLRCEFVEDEELRTKMLADLEDLEAMVSATLAFGRDARNAEPVTAIDLAELLRTVLDEAVDARPELSERVDYAGPAHLTVQARSLSLKRALANLISNACAYGGSAHVTLLPPDRNMVTILVEDDGPGVRPQDLERLFEPFQRGEPSRNRETGGVGLGLPIARNILRAHGGDVLLANRPQGGARATVLLPL
ncbi:MAG: HAMP domain-containing protein [Rhodospirillales bacterium]|nr:HAMP domain-containing protein [Rhodospirillales bacterium]